MCRCEPTGCPLVLGAVLPLRLVLDAELQRLAIESLEKLPALGAEPIWWLLHHDGCVPSTQVLLALKAAIQSCRWQDLPASRRMELICLAAASPGARS